MGVDYYSDCYTQMGLNAAEQREREERQKKIRIALTTFPLDFKRDWLNFRNVMSLAYSSSIDFLTVILDDKTFEQLDNIVRAIQSGAVYEIIPSEDSIELVNAYFNHARISRTNFKESGLELKDYLKQKQGELNDAEIRRKEAIEERRRRPVLQKIREGFSEMFREF